MRGTFGPAVRSLIVIATLALPGCGGGGGALPPATRAAGASSPQSATVTFRIVVPTIGPSARGRRPRYVSVATKSASFAANAGPPTIVNCTNVCSGSVSAPVGTDTFTAKLFDQSNGAGNVLSTGTLTQAIAIDLNNVVNMTFNGVVAGLKVVLNPSSVPPGTPATVAVAVNALDAAGNTIVGPGVYVDTNGNPLTVTLSDSDTSGATKLSQTTLSAPTTGITLAYNGAEISGATILAAAGAVTGSGVLAIACPGPGPATDLYISTRGAVGAFALNASGHAQPLSVLNINGPFFAGGLAADQSAAVDANGTIYRAFDGEVQVFCSLASGNAPVQRTIVTPAFGSQIAGSPDVEAIQALSLDAAGNLYVPDDAGHVTEYAPGAGGAAPAPNSSPTQTPAVRSIQSSQLRSREIGVDPAGVLYDGDGVNVDIYAPSGSTWTATGQTLSQPNEGLIDPTATAADGAGDDYVLYRTDFRPGRSGGANAAGGNAIARYAAGSAGNAAPASVLTFDSNKEFGPDASLITSGSAVIVDSIATDLAGNLYVISVSSSPAITAVAEYTAGSGLSGDATPANVAILIGPNSPNGAISLGLPFNPGQSQPLAIDGTGELYVADCFDNRVVVFAPNGAMLRTFGTQQQVSCPSYVAVTAAGTAYVAAALLPATPTVSIYPPGATQATTPTTISTGGEAPTGLAVDPAGNLYALARDPNSLAYGIEVFAPGSSSASRVFIPADWIPGSQFFNTIGADASGNTYVPESSSSFTYVFSNTASGNAALPNHTLSFIMPSTRGRTFTPVTFVDRNGTVYVGDFDTSSVLIYPKGSTTPSRTIFGDQTELNGIFEVIADAAGDVFASTIYGTVVFPPNANGNVAPSRVLAVSDWLSIGPGPASPSGSSVGRFPRSHANGRSPAVSARRGR